MALVLQSEYSATNTDGNCDVIIIEDSTGDYNAVDNPGGWGAPNPERSEYALYSVLTKKIEGDDTDIVDSANDATATSIDTFNLTSVGDGWYESNLVAIPVYSGSQAYGVNQVVYFTNQPYICTVTTSAGEDPISTPAKWDSFESTAANLRLILDSVATYSPTIAIYTSLDNILETCSSNKIYADAWKDQSSGCAECYNYEDTMKITSYLEGAKISFADNEYNSADKKIQVVIAFGQGNDCTNC